MVDVKFKNLRKSTLLSENIRERIEACLERFTAFSRSNVTATVEMENSPRQAGPDMFSVKVFVSGGRLSGLSIKKKHLTVYKALADLTDCLVQKISRAEDKRRSRKRLRNKGEAPAEVSSAYPPDTPPY